MIDFDALVLRPTVAVFGETFTVAPNAPTAPFDVQGVWSDRPNDIVVGDELIAAGQVRTIGVRASQLPMAMKQGWRITRQRTGAEYFIDGTDDDGQGGVVVTLKDVE